MSYESVMATLAGRGGFMPTEEQRAVIISDAPAILVRAGAGSGKTATMTQRVAYHVAEGHVAPEEVLGLTFTEKAAGELSDRVGRALDMLGIGGDLHRPTISTYNAFAAGIVRDYGIIVGANPTARLITDGERHQLMEHVVENLPRTAQFAALEQWAPSTTVDRALNLVAVIVDNGVSIDELRSFQDAELAALERLAAGPAVRKNKDGEEAAQGWKVLVKDAIRGTDMAAGRALVEVVRSYLDAKRDEGVMEFADQVLIASRVIERSPAVAADIRSRYRLVLLDEYQDTSPSQAQMLMGALAQDPAGVPDAMANWRSICAVGDRNQAIYGWRGAGAGALDDFRTGAARIFGMSAVEELTLSTSFRNDQAVLAAGNAVAERTDAVVLRPRPGAGPGRVLDLTTVLADESYTALARLAGRVYADAEDTRAHQQRDHEIWELGGREGPEPAVRGGAEIAILIRKRTHLARIVAALEAEPSTRDYFEVSGGQPLLDQPEIVTILAGLGVAVDPNRNDLLMRLLVAWNIGVADMRGLREWSRQYAKKELAQMRGGKWLDARDETNLIEALGAISESPAELFSPEGRRRLHYLADILVQLRALLDVPFAEAVASAARILGQDLAAATRTTGSQRVQTSIAMLISMARDYQLSHPSATLADLLAWLEAVDESERGGKEGAAGDDALAETDVSTEVNPGTIQIMTVHAAKGLEWEDLVIVPDLTTRGFAATRKEYWPKKPGVLPYPLRADAEHLSSFRFADQADPASASVAALSFVEETDDEAAAEERRVAYVAFTRPRRALALVSYLYDSPDKARAGLAAMKSGASKQVRLDPSPYLTMVREAAARDGWEVVSGAAVLGEHPAGIHWVDASGPTEADIEDAVQPFPVIDPDSVVDPFTVPGVRRWPQDVKRSLPMERALTVATPAELFDRARDLAETEMAARLAPPAVDMPYYTATDLVHLAEQGKAYRRQLLRPIPREPSRAARVGTMLHARIAQSFGASLMLDGAEIKDEESAPLANETLLYANFLASPWAHARPLAIEQSLELTVEGHILRCTLDAVFDTGSDPTRPAVTIVDWKTGSRPTGARLRARQLQLEVYRLAWAGTSETPLENIGASFVYLAGDRAEEVSVKRRDRAAIEADILDWMRGASGR
ncbi:ATP-dependent DNA helicase [Neoactinobaculum massilliense]|uniref:ATP-dependent DNA helicase n=1 Tax=Neoactinobaculum massilliense TaxID=2364794 RepID=UPI000F53442A|nr:ATP-dependent DNA helicase [Neoactinobaculum massilliense]